MKTHHSNGFTLIEVLIAGLIFAQVALVGAATLASVYRVQEQTSIKRSSQQAVRLILETMTREVHWANSIEIPNNRTLSLIPTTRVTPANPSGLGAQKTFVFDRSNKTISLDSQLISPSDVDIEELIITGRDADHPVVSIYIKVHAKADPDPSKTFEATALAVPRLYDK